MKYKKIIAISIVACLALSACSSSADKDDRGKTKTTEKKADTTVQKLNQDDVDSAISIMEKYLAAYFAGDSQEACKLVTDKYNKERVSEDEAPETCEAQVIAGSEIAKAFGVDSLDSEYSGRIEGKTVIVTIKADDDSTEDYELIQDKGQWKINSRLDRNTQESYTEKRNKIVDEWNALSQEERDSWEDFDAYAKSKGLEPEPTK